MRILYVCTDKGIPLRGGKGASVHVRSITGALQQLGHEVTVAVADGSGDAPVPEVSALVALPRDTEAQQRALLPLAREADVVVERYSLQSGAARHSSATAGRPLVLEVNAPLVAEAARFRSLDDVPRWTVWEAATWSAADAVVAVSQPLRQQVADRAPGSRVHLLRNGVVRSGSTDRDSTRRALGLAPHDIAIAFVGSMKPWHGVEVLLEAAADLPSHVRLILAGHGPLEGLVRAHAESHPGRVQVLGSVPHAEVPALLAACDIGVAPYLGVPDFYFCPLKVMEYLDAGLPVVYSDEGDIADIVGPAGIGVPAGDTAALHRALWELASDLRGRATLAAQARPRVADAGWPDVARRLTDIVAGVA